MNLPTKLTVSRIIMTFIIIFLLLFPFYSIGIEWTTFKVGNVIISLQYIISGILFIIASLTDFVDGYLARKNNEVTDLGKMLDAIADKILVNSVLIILAYKGMIPIVVPVVSVLRDTIVDAIKMQAASRGKVVAAIKSGKLKTATLMVGTTLAFFYNLPFELWSLRVSDLLLIVATVFSVISGIQYYLLNKDLLFKKEETI
ncbi:MAG: CDP-diacylglycerol--glycerol-3-phosphate 3-phosphatidyltransferase [Bacilli bacterium]|nr:CDP-diacylglycerol--glycerol-3-phosphate 3-phosphatidyltransferase [Bacilli bacterium]